MASVVLTSKIEDADGRRSVAVAVPAVFVCFYKKKFNTWTISLMGKKYNEPRAVPAGFNSSFQQRI